LGKLGRSPSIAPCAIHKQRPHPYRGNRGCEGDL
jgi:hypothetical protein